MLGSLIFFLLLFKIAKWTNVNSIRIQTYFKSPNKKPVLKGLEGDSVVKNTSLNA